MINQITIYHLNMIKPILDNETGYCLRLANGQGWAGLLPQDRSLVDRVELTQLEEAA